MCHWRGFIVRMWGLLGMIIGYSAMDIIHGTSTLFEFLCPTIAFQNSSFFSSYPRRKMGFWLWHTNPARFFDFRTWKRHFACLATVLALWSPQHLIKCSRWRFVPHIQRWDGNPMASVSPQILGGITPTQFRPLYKAPKGVIFATSQIFELSRLPKCLNLQVFPNFQVF